MAQAVYYQAFLRNFGSGIAVASWCDKPIFEKTPMNATIPITDPERLRLEQQYEGKENWRLWGPYLAERARRLRGRNASRPLRAAC